MGGFELAATWAGITPVWSNEIDKGLCEKLRKNYNHNIIEGDIRDVEKWKPVDIICGGDPCQPHSHAGLGKGTADDRYLWPAKFEVIRAVNPSYVVNENVYGSISNGVLDRKIDDLESIGYTCQAYCIPAESVGAMHQRERVWLIAYNPNGYRSDPEPGKIRAGQGKKQTLEVEQYQVHQSWEPIDLWSFASDADSEQWNQFFISEGRTKTEFFGFGPNAYGNIPRDIIESAIVGMLNGLPEGFHYNERNKRIKALGNAVVPQVAYEIFKAIKTRT